MLEWVLGVGCLAAGFAAGVWTWNRRSRRTWKRRLEEAKREASLRAKEEIYRARSELERELKEKRAR